MNLIQCGAVVNTHGVRGEMKIKSFLNPGGFEALKSIFIDQTEYKVVSSRPHKGHLLAKIEGIDSIEAVMALKGKTIFCPRQSLALPKGSFIYSDIYGFEVFDNRVQKIIGRLKEVQELPSSMIFVIENNENQTILIPDVDAFYRGVDLENRRLTLESIEGMLPNEN